MPDDIIVKLQRAFIPAIFTLISNRLFSKQGGIIKQQALLFMIKDCF